MSKKENIKTRRMKTVVITGANKGIGFETAKQLAGLGYFVYLGCRNKTKGEEAIRKLNGLGLSNVNLIELDVTNHNSIKLAKQKLETEIDALDVLINNAGIAGDQPQHISTVEIQNLRNVFETNFFGSVQVTQQLLPLLKKSATPRIINVSSQLASLSFHSNANLTDNPAWKIYDAYSCSKAALNAFTIMLSYELSHTNFKINSVEPGYTATDLNQFKGKQTTSEAAETIVKYATTSQVSDTGKFFKKDGELPW